jgi:hypothetical protein
MAANPLILQSLNDSMVEGIFQMRKTSLIASLAAIAALSAFSLPVQATTFIFNDFGSTSGLNLVGDATTSASRLRTTSAVENQVGAAWYGSPVNVAGGFDTYFQFQITNRGGYTPDWSLIPGTTGADGFAFVIQGVDASQIGAYASGLGYFYIPNSLAVEFDTWQNIPEYCEPNGNHVAVQSLGVLPNRPEHCPGSDFNGPFANPNLGISTVSQDMSDGSIYSVRVHYNPGTLAIYLEDMTAPLLTVNVDLANKINLQQGTQAYIGFTSSTGGAFQNHDIVNWSYTEVPEPGTYAMIGAGLIALAIRRRR